MKVPSNCGQILDTDYGNTAGVVFNFPVIVGMTVDRDGNLYISEGSKITKIKLDESIETVKSGFNNLLGIDVKQAAAGGAVFIIAAEFGTGQIKAIATYNLSATPKVIAKTLNARTVAWSKNPLDEWLDIKRRRNTWVCNSGNNVISIKGDYRSVVESVTMEEGRVWISSPVVGDAPYYQKHIRESVPDDTSHSRIIVRGWWTDGIARGLCAYSGDPRSSAPYEPVPADTSICDRPRD